MRNSGAGQYTLFPEEQLHPTKEVRSAPLDSPQNTKTSDKNVQAPRGAEENIVRLNGYIEAATNRYDACIDCIRHDYLVEGINARIRMHFVRFDGDNNPKFSHLARALIVHVVNYSLSAQKRGKPQDHIEHNDLFMQARDLFRHSRQSGEVGELLLYFLLEVVLKAPQVVCKMGLKTNREDEVKGADALHMKWDTKEKHLEVYFGEAKLYQDLSGALSQAFKSISRFEHIHSKLHEFGLISNNFKFMDPEVQKSVLEFINDQLPASNYRVSHACLIGYDWEEYQKLSTSQRGQFLSGFDAIYKQQGERIQKALSKKMKNPKYRNLSYEFFFIPFKSVQEFRNSFYDILFGGNIND